MGVNHLLAGIWLLCRSAKHTKVVCRQMKSCHAKVSSPPVHLKGLLNFFMSCVLLFLMMLQLFGDRGSFQSLCAHWSAEQEPQSRQAALSLLHPGMWIVGFSKLLLNFSGLTHPIHDLWILDHRDYGLWSDKVTVQMRKNDEGFLKDIIVWKIAALLSLKTDRHQLPGNVKCSMVGGEGE